MPMNLNVEQQCHMVEKCKYETLVFEVFSDMQNIAVVFCLYYQWENDTKRYNKIQKKNGDRTLNYA